MELINSIMPKPNIYKIDDVLIKLGYLFIINTVIPVITMVLGVLLLTVILGVTPTMTEEKEDDVVGIVLISIHIFILVNGIIALIVGYKFRKKENKIIQIWEALQHTGETKVTDLCISHGFDRAFVLENLKHINRQKNMYFIFDSKTDKIVDGKLKTEYLVVEKCPGCGNTIDQKVTLDFAEPPKCKYCSTSISVDHLNELKQKVLLQREGLTREKTKKKFNNVVFILLLVFCWPVAIFYFLRKQQGD